jgi:hypothetical protein
MCLVTLWQIVRRQLPEQMACGSADVFETRTFIEAVQVAESVGTDLIQLLAASASTKQMYAKCAPKRAIATDMNDRQVHQLPQGTQRNAVFTSAARDPGLYA